MALDLRRQRGLCRPVYGAGRTSPTSTVPDLDTSIISNPITDLLVLYTGGPFYTP